MNTIQAASDRQQRSQDNIGENNLSYWGDIITNKKRKNQIRCVFQNVNGFGYSDKYSYKAEAIRNFITNNSVDIYAMQELNVDWRRCNKKYTIWERLKGWFENSRVTVANNLREKNLSPYQPGGTGIISQDEMSLRLLDSGKDPRRSGRWTWQLYRGKNNIRMRVVSVYFAAPSNFGERRAYHQQKDALQKSCIADPPEKVFWRDLWEEVDKWQDNGDQVILGGDWNTDVRKEQFLEPFISRGLYPAITGKHGNQAPNTFNGGTYPIDEIFVPANITISSAGYFPCGSGEGDHRPIWVEIDKDSALGANFPPLPTYTARRLKCQDPRIVERYLKVLHQYFEKHGLYTRLHCLYRNHSIPLSPQDIKEYEKLDQLRNNGMKLAEKNVGN